MIFKMAEKKKKETPTYQGYALDTRKGYSYKRTGYSIGGDPVFKNPVVETLFDAIRSAKAGFLTEVQIKPKQAMKYKDLVKTAREQGAGIYEVTGKRQYIIRSTGNAAFRGGPAIGSEAHRRFLEAGGRVAGKGIKAQGYLPKGVSAKQFGILKLGMKTDNPAFTRKKKKKFGEF